MSSACPLFSFKPMGPVPHLKILVVNADDFNLTEGVNRGILECHDRGIVTSTTILINRPLKPLWIKKLKARRALGVGLHLNVTLGEPVSRSSQVKSLLSGEGVFRKYPFDLIHHVKKQTALPLPLKKHLEKEWLAQIKTFQKKFGGLPTHLDTHHQLHDHPFFYSVLAGLSRRFKLPVRRAMSLAKHVMPDLPRRQAGSIRHPESVFQSFDSFRKGERNQTGSRVKPGMTISVYSTTDDLWGDLDSKDPWTAAKFKKQLSKIRPGVTEVMCHVGYCDESLEKISSFAAARERELRIFSSPGLREKIKSKGIILANYGACYTVIRR